MSPSVSQRKRSRTFKARRAPIACQRCRKLKKSCHPTDREMCERCGQSNHDCVYLPVPDDPLALRPGPSSTVLVPDSPTISPLTPSPSSVLYPSDPPYSAPHVTHNTHIPFHFTHATHNTNPGLSTESGPIFAPPPSIFPSDVFSQSQFDANYPYLYHNGLYDDESQAASMQTPLPFTFHQHNPEDMVDPLYAHQYLRSTPNPLLQTNNYFDNFTIPNAAPLNLNFPDTTSDFFTVSSTSNSNHHLHPNMLTSSQSPTSYFEDSDFCPSSQQFCCCLYSSGCAFHSSAYS